MTELAVTVALVGILTAMATLVMPGIAGPARADAALNQVVSQLRRAKELAVTQRRDMEVRFVGTNEIQVVRHDVPNGTTLVSTVLLENGLTFRLTAGLPDTPDRFGSAAAVAFGTATTLLFRSEGIFTDANANLDPLNGTVFLGVPNQPVMSRAVTVFGPTGLVRGYRWNGQRWVE
jgi:hypothetical protein